MLCLDGADRFLNLSPRLCHRVLRRHGVALSSLLSYPNTRCHYLGMNCLAIGCWRICATCRRFPERRKGNFHQPGRETEFAQKQRSFDLHWKELHRALGWLRHAQAALNEIHEREWSIWSLVRFWWLTSRLLVTTRIWAKRLRRWCQLRAFHESHRALRNRKTKRMIARQGVYYILFIHPDYSMLIVLFPTASVFVTVDPDLSQHDHVVIWNEFLRIR
jgi:hypothetical protein